MDGSPKISPAGLEGHPYSILDPGFDGHGILSQSLTIILDQLRYLRQIAGVDIENDAVLFDGIHDVRNVSQHLIVFQGQPEISHILDGEIRFPHGLFQHLDVKSHSVGGSPVNPRRTPSIDEPGPKGDPGLEVWIGAALAGLDVLRCG